VTQFMDVWPARPLKEYVEAAKKAGVYRDALTMVVDSPRQCVRATFPDRASRERASKLSDEVLDKL